LVRDKFEPAVLAIKERENAVVLLVCIWWRALIASVLLLGESRALVLRH
jgi:hypothetical protein